ncbi:MAG TPA: alpha/beta fold hydrolase [Tepidisphaeraceae bacterium]|nr:alpha/beta fold hydrolase [Tepidisphaeraceae bacterium]
MLILFHWGLATIYLAAPAVAMLMAIFWRGRAIGRLAIATIVGTMIGVGFSLLHARQIDSRATFGNVAVASYFAMALLLILKGFDLVLRRLLRIKRRWVIGVLPAFLGLVRGLILIVVGLPFLMSVLMIYRPKAVPRSNPLKELEIAYEPVSFQSTDGVKLSAWWIPAPQPSRPRRRNLIAPDYGAKTVLLCHGWGGNKATPLALVRRLLPAGYNVLAFDFRGHGESGGQVSTLGDLERRDVLGAIQWLKQTHVNQSRHVVGLGVSTGAAALIAAAVDPSEPGQAIEAVAVYGAYDDLGSLSMHLARNSFSPPMDWMASRIGLAMASAQVGADLDKFKPADLVQDLWPRPIFVIHATYDEVVPFEHGQRLFEAATFPKQCLWLTQEDQDDAIYDDSAADAVRRFFDTAHPMPAV